MCLTIVDREDVRPFYSSTFIETVAISPCSRQWRELL